MGHAGHVTATTAMKALKLRALLLATAIISATGLVGCANPQGAVSTEQATGIIGGTDASGDEDFARTVVSLYNVKEGSLCTASILSDTILLTAAHCLSESVADLRVVFGVDLDSDKIIVKNVEAFQVSPLWASRQNQEFNTGDIALVKFAGGLAPGFKPAKLLTNASSLQNGVVTMLAGYGISDGVEGTGAGRLRFVETTIKDNLYSKTEMLVEQAKGKGACHGDSGGPAYVIINGERLVWGVTSRGVDDPKDTCSVSAAYTSVPYYAAWTTRTMTALNSKILRVPSIISASGF